jgi:hypothetical protein
METLTAHAKATAAIQAIRDAARALAGARTDEMGWEARRPAEKRDAILRLMQLENPLTKKPHSASSAEAVVETDEEYFDYLVAQRRIVFAAQIAWGEYEASRLTASLAVALVGDL